MLTSAMERLLFYGKTYAAHVIGTIDYKLTCFLINYTQGNYWTYSNDYLSRSMQQSYIIYTWLIIKTFS